LPLDAVDVDATIEYEYTDLTLAGPPAAGT
jgi:hypothetical protein